MAGWLKVEESKPKNTSPVLTSIRCEEEPPTRIWLIASWIADEDRWADVIDDVDVEAGGDLVTHWMTLPEHPLI